MRFPTVPVSRLALCEANCKKPVYTMHKWWARRLGVVFRMLLLAEGSRENLSRADRWSRFYSPHQLPAGFTVLDPFLGGGTSLVEAAKLGGTCIGVDIDPVACLVSEQELCGADPAAIQTAFAEIKEVVGEKIAALYRSKVKGKEVDIVYFFWVDSITCPTCHQTHDGHPTYQLAYSVENGNQTVVCANCGELETINLKFSSWKCHKCDHRTHLDDVPVLKGAFTCPGCHERKKLYDLYQSEHVVPRLFAKEYLTKEGERCFASTNKGDLELYETAYAKLHTEYDDLPIPQSPIPKKGRFDSRPLLFGYRYYHEMFNSRQLYCLGLIGREIARIPDIQVRKSLALAFSHCLATNNMFCGYAFGYRRLTPLFSVHSFRKISRPVEGNILGLSIGRGTFKNCVEGVAEGCQYMREPYEFRYKNESEPKRVLVGAAPEDSREIAKRVSIYNRSSTDLSVLKDRSVDLILSDPPYFDNLPYSELSDFYHVWLRKVLGSVYGGNDKAHTPLGGALFAGHRKGVEHRHSVIATYTNTLQSVFQECYRVAKDDARFIFTFHHRDGRAWNALGKSLLAAKFSVIDVFPVRSEGRSGLHSYSGTIKWDSIFICEKKDARETCVPSKNRLMALGKLAWSESGRWKAQIRQAGLDFGWADRSSLAMSLVLKLFSKKCYSHPHLVDAFALIERRIARLQDQQSRLTAQIHGNGDREHGKAID